MSAIASISSESKLEQADNVPVSTGIIQVDHDSSDNNNTTISFGDFLDMINPLQHIPVVSAAYRAVTGDTISSTSRIAGDALYSGIFGLASAGLSAVAAIGDEIYAANHDGQGVGASVVASLFGSDATAAHEPETDTQDMPVQIADAQARPDASTTTQTPASETAATPQTQTDTPNLQTAWLPPALQQTPAKQSPILTTSVTSRSNSATLQTAGTTPQTTTPPAASIAPQLTAAQLTAARPTEEQIAAAQAALSPNLAAAAQAASATSDPALGMALNRSKAAYGGVLDTSMMQSAMQNQTLALALANSKNTMQGEHAVRNSRFATASSASPATATITAPAASTRAPVASATAPTSATVPTSAGSPSSQDPIQTTLDQLQAMRSLSRYRSTAQSMPITGSSLDVVN